MDSKPYSVQIELVEGCNKLCSFCALNAIRSKVGENLLYMTDNMALDIAKKCAEFLPTARYEFAMHGEPLIHPEWSKILHIFREALPLAQFQLCTNGKIFLRRNGLMDLHLLMDYVDILVVDTYEPERLELRKFFGAERGKQEFAVFDYYQDESAPSPYHNYHRDRKFIMLMDDLAANTGKSKARVIYNQGGNSPLPEIEEPFHKTCTIPFRELSIRYSGDVNLCCDDWTNEYVIGNVSLVPKLEYLWENKKFELARKFLQNKNRDFAPCANCGAGSDSRAGLLPKYDLLTSEDLDRMESGLFYQP